jgi:hypothetical protein
MKTLPIVWQRLVRDGETCDRCRGTQGELARAMQALEAALRPLGIEPRLEMQEIDEVSFKSDPLRSNAIRIAGRPLEHWLDAEVGSSRCCAACGDADCRTIEVSGRSFETIPVDLIVQAGLRAAAQLVGETPAPCCASTAC